MRGEGGVLKTAINFIKKKIKCYADDHTFFFSELKPETNIYFFGLMVKCAAP